LNRIAPPLERRKRVRMVAVEPAGKLLPWYRDARRKLPWRAVGEVSDPYRVWVSELMLQQTRVETVVPYFLRFTGRFPDLASLAAASESEVLALWSGLGYYSRARALHRAARILVRERGGCLPEDVGGWMELPGVGRYTAGAIVSIAYGKRAPILDGNVARVLTRLYGLRGDPRSGALNRELWSLAERILPRRSISDFNQALMELGALVCTPRAPRCLLCPLREDCVASREGLQARLPELAPRRKSIPVVMAAAIVEERSRILLYRRTRTNLLKGLWELPLGECRKGEGPREAVVREARGTYGLSLEIGEEVARVKHSIMNRRITLHAFEAALAARPATAHEREYRWVGRDGFSELPLSSMVRKVLDRIQVSATSSRGNAIRDIARRQRKR
jgi:A/G-specific adenine glycosylase